MKKALYFLPFLLLLSCGVFTNKGKTNNFVTIQFTGLSNTPYCGGMFPERERENGFFEALANEEYALFTVNDCQTRMKKKSVFTFDEFGKASINIAPGTYALVSTDKLKSVEDLQKKYYVNDKTNYVNGDVACFELWKSKNDLIITIQKDTLITYIQKRKCWTGVNPCLEYTGPPAP